MSTSWWQIVGVDGLPWWSPQPSTSHHSFGIKGTALARLQSFCTGMKQQVFFKGVLSSIIYITTGVPEGSVLGPLLFLLYSADIPVIADKHGLGVHCYADDGQIHVLNKAGEADRTVAKVTACTEEIDAWMTTNRLKLNSWQNSVYLAGQLTTAPESQRG